MNRRPKKPRSSLLSLTGWVLFDWAGQPFYTLILTFLYAPFFANFVVGDAVRGQALWGYAAGVAGLIVAVLSPVLGAIADASGRHKMWVAAFSVPFVIGQAGLWLAMPHSGSGTLALVLALFVLATIAIEFATVFTNAMMPALVPNEALGRLSGVGWAVGYAGGLVSLALTAGLLVADAASGRTLLGVASPLPLDWSAHEGERLIGPFCAVWYALFMIPFFLWTRGDLAARRTANPVRDGLRQLVQTIAQARKYKQVARFLIARMLYADGLGGIFAFGGIYAASLFGWGTMQLGLFGIILTLTGAIGALIGGWLDDRYGARRVILASLALLTLASLGIVSVGADRVLFFLPAASGGGGAPFVTFSQQVYLGFAILIGLVAGPLQAASRSLLARLAPTHMMTEFFGLFAFSGKVTAFAAPFLVGVVTAASGSQRAGIAALLLFLGAGFVLMLGVRESKR